MTTRKLLLCFWSAAFLLILIPAVYAASPGTNATLEFVEDFTSGIGDTLLGYARSLFVGLATLSLALGLGKMLLSGESNIGSVAAHIAKWIIYVGVFFWIMSSSGVATFLPKLIVNSFMQAGRSIAGQDVAPDDLLVAGIRLYGTMVERGWNAGWGDFIGIMLIGIVILVVVAMLAGTMAVALIEMHLVICGGAILIGFGGFEYTRDIALSYLRYSVSIGVKLLMIMIVYALANALLIDWEATFVAATDMATLITAAGQILGGTICIFMASKMVPSMAQSVVSGAALSFGHELFNSTASSVAHGIIGEKSPGSGRSGGLLGAGKTIVESLPMLRPLPSGAWLILGTQQKMAASVAQLSMSLLTFQSSITSWTLTEQAICFTTSPLVLSSALSLTGLLVTWVMTILKCPLLLRLLVLTGTLMNTLVMGRRNLNAR